MRKKITSLFALFLLVAGTAVAQISSLSETSNTKCYTISNSRSSWAVAAGSTQLTTIAKLDLAFSSTDAKQQFALITPDEGANYYLWSVSGNGYVTPSGTLTTDVGACKPVYLNSSKVMYFDSTHYINTNGSNQITIDTWSTADAGNILTIAEAGDFDPTFALGVFDASTDCNVTYVISDANGVVYTSAVVTKKIGEVITTLPSEYQRTYCTYTVTPTTLVAGHNTVPVTVTYSLPFTVSASYDDATWYFAKIRSNYWISMDSTEPYYPSATKNTEDNGKWAFVGNPYTGFSILNKAAGATMVLTKDGNNAVMRSESTETWDLVANGSGFNLLRHGSAQDYIYQNGGTTGYLGFWASVWGATDGGGQWLIEEAPATVTVTYHVVLGGTVIASATETQVIGYAPAVPSSLEFAYTTYTYDVTELTAATTTVVATPTFNTPYTLSTSYDDATWYYMRGHASTGLYPNRYISTNEDAIVWADGNGMTDAYKWALVGNPVQGVQLVNKAAGATKCAQGTNPVAMGTDAKFWTLKNQTKFTNVTGGFGLYDASIAYINCQGGTLKYWYDFDQGSTFWFEEIPNTPYYDALVAVVEPYVTAAESHAGEYFQLAASGEAITNFMSTMVAASQNAANNVDMTEAEYNAALGYFNDALVMPENGYYRLKSRMVDEGDTNYGYVGVNSSATLVGNIADPTADASTVFYVKNNGGYYSFSSQGLYGNVASQSTPVVADATEHDFILGIAAPGYAYIKTRDNYYSCYHVAASQSYQVVGWGSGAPASQFVFEPATDVTVNMNVVGDASYATAYFPFPVQVAGAKVMRVEANTAAGEAYYFETANTIPAGTPVMLVAEDGAATATATIIDSADELTEQNDLVGHYLAGNVSDALVLGASSGVIGFYKLSATGTLDANRAYIDNSTSSDVRALVLAAGETTDETTGISNVATEAAQNGEVYDLSGRRVQNVGNGLYIINGKKVLVK